MISGHAHNYQRHTRRINFQGKPLEVPFIVAGTGGHNSATVSEAYGQVIGDRTFDKSLHGYGYLLVSVTPQKLQVDMWQVPSSANQPFDTVAVDLSTSRLDLRSHPLSTLPQEGTLDDAPRQHDPPPSPLLPLRGAIP